MGIHDIAKLIEKSRILTCRVLISDHYDSPKMLVAGDENVIMYEYKTTRDNAYLIGRGILFENDWAVGEVVIRTMFFNDYNGNWEDI